MNWIILCTHSQDGTELNTNRATAEQDEYKSQQVSVLDFQKAHMQEIFPILDCKRERSLQTTNCSTICDTVPTANNAQVASKLYPAVRRCTTFAEIQSFREE